MKKCVEIIKQTFVRLFADVKNMKWLLLLGFIYWGTVQLKLHRFCPLVQIVGFPCPGCGVTRGVTSILLFRYREAFSYNPTAFIWVLFFIYCFIYRYVLGRKIPNLKNIFIVLVVIMTLVYIYRMYNYFPSDKPLEFNEKNTLGHIIPGYNEYILNWISNLRVR